MRASLAARLLWIGGGNTRDVQRWDLMAIDAPQGTRDPAGLMASAPATVPPGCDQPRGARFGLPSCSMLATAEADNATLPHGTSLWNQS